MTYTTRILDRLAAGALRIEATPTNPKIGTACFIVQRQADGGLSMRQDWGTRASVSTRSILLRDALKAEFEKAEAAVADAAPAPAPALAPPAPEAEPAPALKPKRKPKKAKPTDATAQSAASARKSGSKALRAELEKITAQEPSRPCPTCPTGIGAPCEPKPWYRCTSCGMKFRKSLKQQFKETA